jgi:SAM-dependent methyltransferase
MARASTRQPAARAGTPTQLQRDHYAETASSYDEAFVHEGDEHFVALDFVSTLIAGKGYRSVLDVGSGTGRGIRYLLDRHEGLEIRGVEPVRELIDQAETANGVPEGTIIEGSGESLPFDTDSFDVVCELGVLHHVPNPEGLITEMTRVARRAIFLSDENRFGRGRRTTRLARFALWHTGLWPLAFRIRHRGRRYVRNPEDGGVAYSYSVYDSLGQLNEWAERVFVVPTVPASESFAHPLLSASHGLLCAIRD